MKGYKVVTVPDEIYNVLKRLSEKIGKSMSTLCSEAILSIIEKRRPEVVEEVVQG